MSLIYHLAPAARWRDWPTETPYLPAEYNNDGFIHCTAGDELMIKVANRFYHGVAGDFSLLVIETDLLTSPLKWEQSSDELAELFPHIYGPINLDAVVAVHAVQRAADGTFLGWA